MFVPFFETLKFRVSLQAKDLKKIKNEEAGYYT